eukprot:6076875-Pyramimonas_sp.AAC.1
MLLGIPDQDNSSGHRFWTGWQGYAKRLEHVQAARCDFFLRREGVFGSQLGSPAAHQNDPGTPGAIRRHEKTAA